METVIDYLIPLIILAGILFMRLRRGQAERRRDEEKATTKKRSGLLSRLGEKTMEFYKSVAETDGTGRSREGDSWVSSRRSDEDYDEDYEEDYDDDDEEEEQDVSDETETAQTADTESGTRLKEEGPVDPGRQTPPGVEPAPVSPAPVDLPPISAKVSRSELRKAVVWSEILSPPVALRDK